LHILYYPADADFRDAVELGKIAETPPGGTITEETDAIDLERSASDLAALDAWRGAWRLS